MLPSRPHGSLERPHAVTVETRSDRVAVRPPRETPSVEMGKLYIQTLDLNGFCHRYQASPGPLLNTVAAEGNLSELWAAEQTFPPAAALVCACERLCVGEARSARRSRRAPEPRRLLRVSHLRGRGTEPVDGPHTHTSTRKRD